MTTSRNLPLRKPTFALPARVLDDGRLAAQWIISLLIGVGLPFALLVAAYRFGFDISDALYGLVVGVLIINAGVSIWEGLLAVRRADPPAAADYPPATVIIAAYLPNEAAILPTTLEAFLRLEYAGPLQIILAYNTPHDMAYERQLQAIAARDPRFLPLRVMRSTSKAENVNAALAHATGTFIGLYDADHLPGAGSLERAWGWLNAGYDIVQGRCTIRNGGDSWVARTVAVEFEAIYGLAHPGRARMHGFGIFGGSNGFWRADLLRAIGMHGNMLTEDIDSSFRAIAMGKRIMSDPYLISRELAPTRLRVLLNQRLRWAQGWFQVSMAHSIRLLRSPAVPTRNKLGILHLLVWRECLHWVSMLVLPLILFQAWMLQGADRIDWFVPLYVMTTLITLSTLPIQIVIAWRLAHPDLRTRTLWFWLYLAVSLVFYAEFKNTISRIAQIKEFAGERAWKTTVRA